VECGNEWVVYHLVGSKMAEFGVVGLRPGFTLLWHEERLLGLGMFGIFVFFETVGPF
jgi:hypothetical protein